FKNHFDYINGKYQSNLSNVTSGELNFKNHFDYINGKYQSNLSNVTSGELNDGLGVELSKPFLLLKEPLDTDFINTLKKLAKDCLSAPCNYFDHGGSFGFLSHSAQMLNPMTSPSYETTNDTIGIGIHDQETFMRMPPIFQRISTKLNQVTTTTINKVVQGFNNAITRSLSGGNIMTPDTNTYEQYSKAQSSVLANLAQNLGDCFRMDDFRRRYNPFSYYEQGGANGEQAAPPGISGMPVGYKNVKNNSLNSTLSGTPKTFVTNNTWYCPGGGSSVTERALEGGVQDRRGRPAYTYEDAMAGIAPYVTVAMDTTVLPYGTLLHNENFKRSDGTLLPFRVTDTGGAFAGKGFAKMDIATSSIQKARGGPNFNGTWIIAGDIGANVAPSPTGVAQQPNPNDCNGLSNNGAFNMSPRPEVGSVQPGGGNGEAINNPYATTPGQT
ncbi:MAG: hypothetical protein EBU90_30200, partial [Proteobacteria bacterium]|nr:hypothetical protein [Pseudomonadota bacterium]